MNYLQDSMSKPPFAFADALAGSSVLTPCSMRTEARWTSIHMSMHGTTHTAILTGTGNFRGLLPPLP